MTSLSITPEKTWAILIGCGEFKDSGWPRLPAVRENLRKLWQLLSNTQIVGIPSQQIISIDENQSDIIQRIAKELPRRLETLFVYYAGHGLLDDQQQLYLAKHDTFHDRPDTALAFAALWRETVERHGAINLIYWLDCCYSGNTLTPNKSVGKIPGKNISVLTSTLPNEEAKAPSGKSLTAFTECLIELLEKGFGNEPTLTTARIYEVLAKRLPERGFPKPWWQDFLIDDGLRIAYNRSCSDSDNLIGTGSKAISFEQDDEQIVHTTTPHIVIEGSVEQVTSVNQVNGDLVFGDKIAGNKVTHLRQKTKRN